MKPIKMFGLAALFVLMAIAFVGASSAMAESTVLCSSDIEEEEEEAASAQCKPITHVHEVSVGKGQLLSSVVSIECEVLFLGDASAKEGAPLEIKGHFTYPMTGCETTSGTLCEVTETSKEAATTFLRTAHELTEVKGTAEVNAHCGSLINCTYNHEGLVGHGLGPLLSKSTNGNVNISEQVMNKTGGAFCPKVAKLDLTTTPLTETFIPPRGLLYCVQYEHITNGFYQDDECTEEEAGNAYDLVWARRGLVIGQPLCIRIWTGGLWREKINRVCTNDNTGNLKGSPFEKGVITKIY